jgi:NADH dehydrogenase [ubiquinone] 1 alpha subcomplex assembly factor 5
LQPDGLFVAALLGEPSLEELRSSFLLAEQERLGGVASHVSPLAGLGDIGNLLQYAGLTLPTVDQERIHVEYADLFSLGNDLQGMAEQAAPALRRRSSGRDVFLAAAAIYSRLYGRSHADGGWPVPATFTVVWALGWAPHSSQPLAAKRGSATQSFKDLDKLIPSR